jgi:phospholipid/cholesterol/gamma-HCH transport system permease protein
MYLSWRWNVIQLIAALAVRLPALRQVGVREVFWRQFNHLGLEPAASIFLRAALLGTLIIAAVINLLASNSDLAVNFLIHAVVREVGPSLTAMLLILRSSVVVTGDVMAMVRRDDPMRMRAMGIDPLTHVFLPRVAALALACVVVTFYFELIAVLGGIVLASLWLDVSLAGMLIGFIETLRLVDLFYSLLKSAGFGILLGAVPCVVALHWGRQASDPVAVISRAMMRTLMYVAAFNALFAYLVYGALLFGLISDGSPL